MPLSEAVAPLEPSILHSWSVPRNGDLGDLHLDAIAGACSIFVGANGAGKSALATYLTAQVPPGRSHRVIAHRKTWFASSGSDMNVATREQQNSYVANWDKQPDSRYLDHADNRRAGLALFDILGAENSHARSENELFHSGYTVQEVADAVGESPLDRLNVILRDSGMRVQIAITSAQSFEVREQGGRPAYPIHLMSDGEKSVLLLVAEVLTAASSQVFIIDEPERHVHRSISARLLAAMIRLRPDCAFFAFTHDIDLATRMSRLGSATYVVRNMEWSGPDQPRSWSVEAIADGGLSDAVREAILGGRESVVFVEGEHASLDFTLYRLLFPGMGIVPAGSCENVIRAVQGLRAQSQMHWLTAWGIVDGDGRSELEVASLSGRGVHSIAVNEVESLLYVGPLFDRMMEAVAEAHGYAVDDVRGKVNEIALSELRKDRTAFRLAKDVALKQMGRAMVDAQPHEIGTESTIEISLLSPLTEVSEKVELRLAEGDVEWLLRYLPIRNSSLRGRLAAALHFDSFKSFEQAALVAMGRDDELAERVRSFAGLDEITN